MKLNLFLLAELFPRPNQPYIPTMARGHQKLQSQVKNAKRLADAKRSEGHDQKKAAQKALIHQCSVCKVRS